MDGYLVNVCPWKAPSPDLFRGLQSINLWVRLERVRGDFRTLILATGLLGTVSEVIDVGMFSSLAKPGYFLRGFVRLDLTRPFIGRRLVRPYSGVEFGVCLCYEGLPPVCFRCGYMGHTHGRCSEPSLSLDPDERGSWMSLPTGSYRRVDEFTFQPIGHTYKNRDDAESHRQGHHDFVARPYHAVELVDIQPVGHTVLPGPSRPKSLHLRPSSISIVV
ncbi:hypothetical protein LINGRAHAP2_LOCUS19927 [Linum grandiflorum]